VFKSFFKPKWQHHDPGVRKSAIGNLGDPDLILNLVHSDPDMEVRCAALVRIDDAAILDELIETLPSPLKNQARSQRLAQLLPDPSMIGTLSDNEQLIRIASLTDDIELINQAVAGLSTESRFKAASGHTLAAVRLCAAKGIDDIEQLKQLMIQARGKDKALFRYCKSVVDADKAEKQAAAALAAKIDALIQQAKQLSGGVDTPDFGFRYQAIKSKWASLEPEATAVQFAGMDHYLEHCAQRAAKMEAERAADEQRKQQAASAEHAFETIVAEIRELDATASIPEDAESIRQLKATLDGIEQRWLEAGKQGTASAAQGKVFQKIDRHWHQLLNTINHLRDREPELARHSRLVEHADRTDFRELVELQGKNNALLKSLTWPRSREENTPGAIRKLQVQQENLAAWLKKLDEGQDQYLKHLLGVFDELKAAVKDNHVKDANRAVQKIRKALKPLRSELQDEHQGEFRTLMAQVNELRDWQGFAIEPKKVDLCARMTALVDADEHPEVLASRIKSLQEEWKGLGPISPARDRALWKEFSSAADQAFEPCKAYFAEQAKMRAQNLESRMQLIAQLRDYDDKMNWPDRESKTGTGEEQNRPGPPDWKTVQKTLDAARQAFRDISPVTHKGEKKSQKAFREICDRIYAHIKAEYERNIEARQSLIARAEKLQASENLNEAINQAKRLQIEWKEVGMTPMKIDRKLWQQFRTACNAIFGRLDQQRAEERAATDAQVTEADQILQKAGKLFENVDDEQGLHLNTELASVKQELSGLGLPDSISRRYMHQIRTLEEKAQAFIEGVRSRQQKARWQSLNELMVACALNKDDSTALSESPAGLPKGIDIEGLNRFRQLGPADDDTDTWRDNCIALEIMFGADSPGEDRQARMDYQVKRLQEGGLGQHHENSRDTLITRINAFISLRPSSTWTSRFCSVLEQANPNDTN
jgi:hypothetical protein